MTTCMMLNHAVELRYFLIIIFVQGFTLSAVIGSLAKDTRKKVMSVSVTDSLLLELTDSYCV